MSTTSAQPYGSLQWLANGELQNTSELSVAKMIITPGAESDPHFHSNCEEASFVIRGEVEEVIEGVTHRLRSGETAVAPRGVSHHFRNVGNTPAEVLIVFSSAFRSYEPAG